MKRIIVATVFGLFAGVICASGAFLGGILQFTAANLLWALLNRAVMGFAIGASRLPLYWAWNGVVMGLVVGSVFSYSLYLNRGDVMLPLVNALLIIRDPIKESAPLLRELLKDPNLNVRYEAACTLARLKEDGKEAIPELREMLKKPNTSWRDRAIAALAAFGPAAKEALPDLINQWRSAPTIDIQLRMAEPILAIDPEKGKPVVKWLRDQTSNGNVFYRLMALRQLAKHDAKNPDVLKSLLTMAHYPQPYYAGMALEVIGLLGPEAKSALPEVRAALKDADVGKRVRAAGALWRIEGKTEEAVPVLTAALKEHDAVAPGAFYSSVPRSGAIAAAVTLGEIGPAAKAALPALRHAMTLGDVGLRQNSLTAIAKIEKK